jgi:hypothetical protein
MTTTQARIRKRYENGLALSDAAELPFSDTEPDTPDDGPVLYTEDNTNEELKIKFTDGTTKIVVDSA